MITEYIIGYVVIKATGFSEYELLNELKKHCKVLSLNKENDAYYIKVNPYNANKVISICEKVGFVAETIERKGIYFTLCKYVKRYGLYFGIAVSIMTILYFSNIVLKIEIYGTNDEDLKTEIIDILKAEGLFVGCYIPSVNFIDTNLKLTSLCDDVAWSSIAHTGSVVKIDLETVTNKTELQDKRIPSNIVAKRDGVIVDAQVLSGQLEVLIGDAVSKNELLVSGIIERRNGVTYYYHSLAKIIAEFDESVQISQNYKVRRKSLGKTHYIRSLRFFDSDFNLNGFKTVKGNFEKESDTSYIYFFGIKLPIGITMNRYTEVSFNESILSTEEAFFEAYRLLENYEKNVLANDEIISRNIKELMNEDGITLYVDYELKGDICKQSYIFAK